MKMEKEKNEEKKVRIKMYKKEKKFVGHNII